MLKIFLSIFVLFMVIVVGCALYVDQWTPYCSELLSSCDSTARSIDMLKVGTICSLIMAALIALEAGSESWN